MADGLICPLMSEMDLFQAIILGVIQGATEFLPVSSSGHLVLAEYFMDVQGGGLAFDVFLHMGTLLAVLIYFWKDWFRLLGSIAHPSMEDHSFRLLVYLILATIPGAAIGVAMEGWVEHALRSPWVVVTTLTLVAIVLYVADRQKKGNKEIRTMGLKDALFIGISQGLAVIPGVSRSGITMSTGLLVGLDRAESARFSFLLSCPIILGAGLYEGIKLFGPNGSVEISRAMLIGLFSSFVSGILVISFLLNFLRRHTFVPFVLYRIGLAILVVLMLIGQGEGRTFGAQKRHLFTRLGKSVVNITSKALDESYVLKPCGEEGLISGILIDDKGHVVTDGSGMVDRRSLEVTLWNGSRWPARYLGDDPPTGVAVLEIEAPEGVLTSLMPFQLSIDPTVLPGNRVVVIGNPMGTGTAILTGSIFSMPRSIATRSGFVLDNVFVIDRAVPRAMAGGALVSLASGMGIGMITTVFSCSQPGSSQCNSLQGFAIPFSYILRVSKEIITKGHVDHVWVGAVMKSITPQMSRVLGLPVEHGVLVLEVKRGSPAWRAGLRGGKRTVMLGNRTMHVGGDIIVAVNGKECRDLPWLVETLEKIGPGKKVRLKVLRKGREMRLFLPLAAKRY